MLIEYQGIIDVSSSASLRARGRRVQLYQLYEHGYRKTLPIFASCTIVFNTQLTEKVSGWYPDFTCSESQLRDIASRIKFMNSTRNIHHIVRDTANLTDYPGENECNYWNHRIVGGDCGVLSGGGLDGSVGPTAKALDWEPEGAEAGHEDLEWVERNVLKKIRAYHFCSFCTS